MSFKFDSRGIRRGRCTEYGCSCIGYDGGMEMKKCTKCPHPPGKHTNLSIAGSVGSSTSNSIGSHTTPHNLGNHNFGGDVHHNAGGSVPQSYQPSYVQYHQPTRSHPQLPECQANGCFNRVHCDPSLPEGLRQFSYCSPECRDRHLLPMEKVNLTVALSDMKKKLQEVAAAEKRSTSLSGLQRQSSSEYSSRPSAGGSLVTGIGNSSSLGVRSSSSTPAGAGYGVTTNSSSVTGDHHISRASSSAASGGDSNKKAKEQKTSVVSCVKLRFVPFGVLLSKRLHHDKIFGFIIIGATNGSPAYTLLQNGKIRIFDVIISVNDKTCSELILPTKANDLQFCLDHHLKERVGVKLLLSHSISLPPISSMAFQVCTHLIALRYSPNCRDGAYGLTLNLDDYGKIVVGGKTTDTPADDSGIQVNDEVQAYAVGSREAIGDAIKITKSEDNMELYKKFDEAQNAKKSIILMIWRSRL